MFESLKSFGLEARYDGSPVKGRNIGFLRINMEAVAYPFVRTRLFQPRRPLVSRWLCLRCLRSRPGSGLHSDLPRENGALPALLYQSAQPGSFVGGI